MPKIENLVQDIKAVLEGNGGWDAAITQYFAENMKQLAETRLEKTEQRNYLSLSSIGFPCKRKLWYKVNKPEAAQKLNSTAIGTFLYGDMTETFVLSLVKAAGHDIQAEQETVKVSGIKGHIDCIIDGMVVDVKSSNGRGFYKFFNNKMREEDPFGYLSQLSSYVYACGNDSRVTEKTKGAFLGVNKERFELALDVYDFSSEISKKEEEVKRVKEIVKQPEPPPRLNDEPQSPTSPNRKLCVTCSYCEYKKECWPTMRTFLYSNKPEYLTKVVKEPKVTELIE